MNIRTHRLRSAKLLAAGLAVGASLVLGALMPGHAAAGLVGCDLDPVVSLSNGAQLTINNYVYDVSSDIQNVTYTLHLPAGVTVSNVSYPDGLGVNESVNAYSDQNWKTYLVSSVTSTGTAGVSVTEQANLNQSSGWGQQSLSASTSGLAGQPVTVQLRLDN